MHYVSTLRQWFEIQAVKNASPSPQAIPLTIIIKRLKHMLLNTVSSLTK